MPAKKTARKTVKTAKKRPPKKTKKTVAKKKATPKVKKGQSYECRVCGYRVVVDEVCGCAEEHYFICCDKPMKKKRAKK